MTILQDHDDAAFARPIIGALGKLTEDLKTKVDERTAELFRHQCSMSSTDTSGLIRDFVYLSVYGKTYRAMAAEKLIHDQERTDALRALTGQIQGPEFAERGGRA
ncbi:hypothetical protein D3C71_1607740 [compost metagenome]